MITCTVRIVTKPTEHERFVAATKALREATIEEEGNLEYSLWVPLDGSNEVLVFERWADQAASMCIVVLASGRLQGRGQAVAATPSTRSET
jgi:quinol monooxygenase YgiN